MKKMLTETKATLYHYKDGARLDGPHAGLRGNCTYLCGDCTDLRGYCSGLQGDCSGLRGDLDACDLTAVDRSTALSAADAAWSVDRSTQVALVRGYLAA